MWLVADNMKTKTKNKKQTAQVDVTKNKRDKKISKFFFSFYVKMTLKN